MTVFKYKVVFNIAGISFIMKHSIKLSCEKAKLKMCVIFLSHSYLKMGFKFALFIYTYSCAAFSVHFWCLVYALKLYDICHFLNFFWKKMEMLSPTSFWRAEVKSMCQKVFANHKVPQTKKKNGQLLFCSCKYPDTVILHI